ncbi:MAG: nicotinate phosphoribosyltransferase [Clostridia bacterium]|nr:nicotinate phosphoribosyltransferase [Clostridia bacterium]
MKLSPIIESLLDTDLYKFNMNMVMFHKHTNLNGKYLFKCRNNDVVFTEEMVEEINAQIDHLCTLKFSEDELSYLNSISFIKSDYVEFLRLWHPIRKYVTCYKNPDGELFIEIVGPLFSVMQFEVYLLEIVNEVYFRMKYDYSTLVSSAQEKLDEKIKAINEGKYTFRFAEFGCRRRLSREWQDHVVKELLNTDACVGTSNVYLAMKYGCRPIGTYAHEYVQMYQGIPGVTLAYTNKLAMEEWFEEFQGDNGTALTDTLGTALFLKDFDKLQAMCYTGVRHDSGDPIQWGEMIIDHYQSLGIDPRGKTLLFSDSLDFDRAQEIHNHFKGRVNVSFGIGTFLTNDTCENPLNIVIKLQYVNGHPVAKLSDVPGKAMCQDEDYLSYLKSAVEYRLKEGI